MLIVLVWHVLINLNNIAVSAYLAYTLSHRMSTLGGEFDESKYDLILLSIMLSAVITSFLGKYFSNLIVRSHLSNDIQFMQIN